MAESTPPAQATPSPQTSPSTFDPYRSDIPLTASLSPTCVARGGTVTITVETIPEVVVGYETFYADGKSGAIKPHGAGYGGTNGDYAESGSYTDTWTVSLDAPLGPGKADVFVGQGDQWGYQEVAFEIVESAVAACDAS